MKREYSYCFGAIIILLAAGCSPPQDPQKIEIAVPAVQRGDLEKLSDPSYLFPDYKGPRPTLNGQGLNIFGPVRLFVRKGAEPKTAGDFKNRTLIVCCNVPLNRIPPLAGADPRENPPLFNRVDTYIYISEGTDCYQETEQTKGPGFEGRELTIHCGDGDDIVSSTEARAMRIVFSQMKDTDVLLVSDSVWRNSDARGDDFVEVVLK